MKPPIKEKQRLQGPLYIDSLESTITQFLAYLEKNPRILDDLTSDSLTSQAFLLDWYIKEGEKLFHNNTQPLLKEAYRSYQQYTRTIKIKSLGKKTYLKYFKILIPNLLTKKHCMGLKLFLD